jgi:hypothetical protein
LTPLPAGLAQMDSGRKLEISWPEKVQLRVEMSCVATAYEPKTRAASAPGRRPQPVRRRGRGSPAPVPVPVGGRGRRPVSLATGHRGTQRPRGQVGPRTTPTPSPAQPPLCTQGAGVGQRFARPPLAPMIAQLQLVAALPFRSSLLCSLICHLSRSDCQGCAWGGVF